jgi:thymidylate kinase
MILMCEGMDCSGKTSTIRRAKELLEEKVQVDVLKGAGTATLLGRAARRTGASPLFFLESLVAGYRAAMRAEGTVVLLDRYWWTPYTFCERRIAQQSVAALYPVSDGLVLFAADQETLRERLSLEHDNRYHHYLLENPGEMYRRERQYKQLYAQFPKAKTVIDTSGMDIKQSAERLVRFIDLMRTK